MKAANIKGILDLSVVKHNNLKLVVKKAVEFVEVQKNSGNGISGINFRVLPEKSPGKVIISLNKKGESGDKLVYSPPRTWKQQLTVACFVYSIGKYADLGNRANVLCTNSRSRGDLQDSISTKHAKSRLQKKLNALLDDAEFIGTLIPRDLQELPDGITPKQKELIRATVDNKVNRSSLMSIIKNHGTDTIQVYNEWKSMDFVENLDQGLIPLDVDFPSMPVHEVIEMLNSDGIVPSLRKEIKYLEEQLFSSQREGEELTVRIEELLSRNLWQRIMNK